MKRERKKESFIAQPFYEGGSKALEKFITENLIYPSVAIEKKVEGTVLVKYDIDHSGVVIAAHIVGSLGGGCDEEAIRLVKLLRFSVPKQPRGLKVVFHKDLYIHFRLPKQAVQHIEIPLIDPPIMSNLTPQYQYAISPKKVEKKPILKPKQSYQITINI